MTELDLPDDLVGICTQELLSDDLDLPERSGAGYKLDSLLAEADFSAFESATAGPAGAERCTAAEQFASPKTDQDVQQARSSAVPKNTTKNTAWATRLYQQWESFQRQHHHPVDCPPHLLLMRVDEVNRWLSLFVLEVRKESGELYNPTALYQLCCGLLRAIREYRPEWNILKESFVESDYRN